MFCFLFISFAPFLCLLFYTLAARLLDPSPKTVPDVILVLRPVSILELEDLFEEIKERNLRLAVPTPQFRDIQRTRSSLLFEYLRRMSFNTLMLLVWAYAEEQRTHGPGMHRDEAQSKPIHEMIEFGTKSRSYCLFAMFNMAWRILLGRFRAAKAEIWRHCDRSLESTALKPIANLPVRLLA